MGRLHRGVLRSKARADRSTASRRRARRADGRGGTGARRRRRRGPKGLTAQEYDGWRQYSDKCARCHGQDALPNPVAANLLESLAPNGPMHDQKAFTEVVTAGRIDRGMPAFGKMLEPGQVQAIYGYLVGRAEKRIPPGRPERPGGD